MHPKGVPAEPWRGPGYRRRMSHDQHGPASGIRRTLSRLRSRGAAEVLTLAWSRIRENLWSAETLVLYVAATEPGPIDAGDLVTRFAAPEDGETYARDIGTDSASTFRRRLDPATRCFVVEEHGRFLHSSWVATGKAWTREIRGYLTPPDGDAYVYESFTRSDARGRGIYPLALRSIRSELAAGSVGRLWVGVEDSNVPSRRAVAKAGFEEGFSLHYRRRFGFLLLAGPQGRLEGDGAAFLRARKTG